MGEPIFGTFRSVTGEMLEKCLWPADGEAKGIVQFVHGMAEHIRRYDWAARQLNRAGYTVVGHTHLGHGESAPVKGYFADQGGWDALIADTHTLRQDTQSDLPGLPYFLLGHSMGSFVARCYALVYGQGLSGLIISGTGHFGKPIVSAGSVIAGLQCFFGGAKKPSMLLHNMNFAANNKTVPSPRTDSDWLTRDDHQVDLYRADPLCGFPFTAKAYGDMFDGLKRLYPEKLSALPMDLPVYMFSGQEDPVGAYGKGVEQAAAAFRKAGMVNVTVKLYPACRHEILNELNSQRVFDDISVWLERNLPREAR
jgi:alpha-beta hydrolase superfamily lysophospholipase